MSEQQYAVLMPVKPPAIGKSRLAGLPTAHRRDLAEAFALDTIAAASAAHRVGAVLVVTDDVAFAALAGRLGAAAIPDGVSNDLNGTLRQAAADAVRRWPDLLPVALCADLPALRSDDLDTSLGQVVPGRACFVPDAADVGTTLYAAPLAEFDPRFGPGSCEAHLDAGARLLVDIPTSVRLDVDDLGDLRWAVDLGVGRRTAALVS